MYQEYPKYIPWDNDQGHVIVWSKEEEDKYLQPEKPKRGRPRKVSDELQRTTK